MIKNLLEKDGLKRLIINENIVTDITIAQPLQVSISQIHQTEEPIDDFLVIKDSFQDAHNENSYFLPWRTDSGLYLDLPINDPQANLFFTDGLSGCCLGIQRIDAIGIIRVCHYNLQGSNFDISDFERYNEGASNRKWLIPQGYEFDKDPQNPNFKYYPTDYIEHPNQLYWTYFWGEYDVENHEWKFYYQSQNKFINVFDY
jgi:hypothetical protein